jgi:hypothetical protein
MSSTHSRRASEVVSLGLGWALFACASNSPVGEPSGPGAADAGGGSPSEAVDASSSRAGGLALLEAGTPHRADGGPAATTPLPERAGASTFGVFEQDLAAPGDGYANPWEDVDVAMMVTSPTGRITTVGGFFFSGSTYKARFRPDERGTWTWSATISDKNGASTAARGTFDAAPDGGHGFIRKSDDNANRWKWEDGTPYYGLGLQGGMPSAGAIDQPGGIWGGCNLGGQPVNLETFLKTTATAGFNMLRWTLDNGTPGLFTKIEPEGNVYRQQEGADGDRIVAMARAQGFAVLFTFFNFWINPPPYFKAPAITVDQAKALQRYVQYLINRFGANIDIWEVVNEGNASPAWYAAVIPYLKSHDPYRHDVSTSTVFALDKNEYASGVTLNMVHWYAPVTEAVADEWTFSNLQDWKSKANAAGANANTIVGETGNCCNVCNYGPAGFRLRSWAAFFGEGILVYWDQAETKTACGSANTNYYIGDEERAFAKTLQDFTAGFDPKAHMATVTVTGASLHAYALAGPVDTAIYLVNPTDHEAATSGVKVTVSPEVPGHAVWIDPSTGAKLAELDVPAGPQTIDVPSFVADVAFKIHAAR